MAAEAERASDLQFGQGSALWRYWTKGGGLAKWSGAVHKWTTLRDLLLAAGVPAHSADGLATNIIMAVMPGYMKLAHAKGRSGMDGAGGERFNPNHVPGGAGGGQFTSGGGGGGKGKAAPAKAPAKAPAGKPKAAAKPHPALPASPNGLGYSAAQWRQLQQWEADYKAGKKLDHHQLHMLHEAHLKHVAALGRKAAAGGPDAARLHAQREAHKAHAARLAREAAAAKAGAHKAGRSVIDAISEYERAAKPYGDVAYADPKNGKYPIDTADHAKAAWAYISMPKNAAQYPMNGVTLDEVKKRIMAACKKFGITVADTDGDMNAAHFAPDVDVVRSGEGITLEPSADGSPGTMTGRFSEFGRWYPVSSRLEGNFLERVAPGATVDTIRDHRDSMRVLFDHGMDPQIGNKVLGPIAVLEERSDGPWYEVPLFDTSYNRDLLPGLKARAYGASMRMRVTGDQWDDEPKRSDSNPDGIPERTITAMKVLEFGPVTFPANPGASAGVRSATDEFYGRLAGVDPPAFADAVRACGLSPEDFTSRVTARSGPGREHDVQPGHGRTSLTTTAALRDRAWRMREVR
jgi:HK97 family phage prohead protease